MMSLHQDMEGLVSIYLPSALGQRRHAYKQTKCVTELKENAFLECSSIHDSIYTKQTNCSSDSPIRSMAKCMNRRAVSTYQAHNSKTKNKQKVKNQKPKKSQYRLAKQKQARDKVILILRSQNNGIKFKPNQNPPRQEKQNKKYFKSLKVTNCGRSFFRRKVEKKNFRIDKRSKDKLQFTNKFDQTSEKNVKDKFIRFSHDTDTRSDSNKYVKNLKKGHPCSRLSATTINKNFQFSNFSLVEDKCVSGFSQKDLKNEL